MKLIITNPGSDPCSYASGIVIIPEISSLEVPVTEWFNVYSDNTFWKDLKENNITLNDGVRDYNFEEAEKYLKLIVSDFNQNNRDTDGAFIVRNKAAKKGWSFWAIPIEVTTSTLLGSMYCKTSDDLDIPGVNCKIYNSSNEEITTAGLLNANLNTCVKTVIDFEPNFDFEIIGGALRINANPSQDIRLWIVGAPDIPAQFGGSKEFASGINLKFLAQDSSFEIDGRVAKFLTYNPTTHQGKMRILLKHPAGLQVNLQFVVHLYRQ